MRSPFRYFLILAATAVLSTAAAAQTRIDPRLAVLKKQAAQLSASGKHLAAAERIGEARNQLRVARRQAMGSLPRPAVNPKYRAALEKLQERMRARWARGPRSNAAREALMRDFNAEKEALARKYPSAGSSRTAERSAQVLRIGARHSLVDAGLEDLQATYLERGGNAAAARRTRTHAVTQRLEAYETLGKDAQAQQAASRLLAMDPSLDTYRRVAEFHQNRRRYTQAAEIWRRGLDHLESGRTGGDARTRAQNLSYFYRQLAFAHSRSGKAQESKQALDRALQIERTHGL